MAFLYRATEPMSRSSISAVPAGRESLDCGDASLYMAAMSSALQW